MDNFDVLNELIKDDARVIPFDDKNRLSVILKEPSYPQSQVKISGLPNNAIVIKSDYWPPPDRVFTGSKNECKRADYIIISEKNDKLFILYIELKNSNSTHRNDVINQFKGVRCLFDYCQSIGKMFWKKRDFLDRAQHRYICFAHTSIIKKRRTRIERQIKRNHNQPEDFMKICWPNHNEFNELCGS